MYFQSFRKPLYAMKLLMTFLKINFESLERQTKREQKKMKIRIILNMETNVFFLYSEKSRYFTYQIENFGYLNIFLFKLLHLVLNLIDFFSHKLYDNYELFDWSSLKFDVVSFEKLKNVNIYFLLYTSD